MIRLTHVDVDAGVHTVLEDVTWHLTPGEHVGLVGPNGSGKTTLLRVLSGALEPVRGEVQRRARMRVGVVEQHLDLPENSTLGEVARAAMVDLVALEERLHRAERAVVAGEAGAEERLSDALEAWRLHGGPAIDERIGETLAGLGFAQEDVDKPWTSFSGGWRMRVALARLLLSDPDLLLLDEPTNHLDIAARSWLANRLVTWKKTLVLVSHDRFVLEKVATTTVEIRGGHLEVFHGPPSRWVREREARDLAAQAERLRREVERSRLQETVDRLGAKATKAAAARHMEHRIERLDAQMPEAPVAQSAAPKFHLPEAPPCARELVVLEKASFGYDDGPVWHDVSLHIERGQRMAILGANGAGKSTLLKVLTGSLALFRGRRTLGRDVRLAVHAQDLANQLDPDATAVEVLRSVSPLASDTKLRGVLGALGLKGEASLRPCHALSGGQRARVVLAEFVLRPANLLLLDEPTNHLDATTAEVLANALAAWEGGLVLVTHDRWLVERLATHTVLVKPGRVEVFDGVPPEVLEGAAAVASRRESVTKETDKVDPRLERKNARQEERRLQKLERAFERLSAEIDAIDTQLYEVAADRERARELSEKRDALEAELEAVFTELESVGRV